MLVLARKKGQSIIVNGETEVVLLQIQGDQVRLGITAPKHISVQRKELIARLEGEGEIREPVRETVELAR